MKRLAEVIKSEYNETDEKIYVRMVLNNTTEIDPPTDSYVGDIVDGMRWIRQVNESFNSNALEIQSKLVSNFLIGDTTLELQDVTRLPNDGLITINRGGETDETLSYTSRDLINNVLLGIQSPTYNHYVNETAHPYVSTKYLGTFDVDLQYFPIRYGQVSVQLNGTTNLLEGTDFIIVNEWSGSTCAKGYLRFLRGSQLRRFNKNDFIDITYQYFVEAITTIQTYTKPETLEFINVFENDIYNKAFLKDTLVERDLISYGNIIITPSVGNTVAGPVPVKVAIPNIELPKDVVLSRDVALIDTEIYISDVKGFIVPGALVDYADDTDNRKVLIGSDIVSYTNIDSVNKKLIGVTGITATHIVGDAVTLYDAAKMVRDIIKNAINSSSTRAQVEATSTDSVDGHFLTLKCRIENASFNLKPGTYSLSYLGFNENLSTGQQNEVTTAVAYQSKDYTYQIYNENVRRHNEALRLLGQSVSTRVSVS